MSIETHLVTVDEFEDYIAQPEHAERHFELIHGEIIEDMPTEEHSAIAGNLYFHLRLFVEPNKLGRVSFEVRRQVPDDKHNARLPDVDFTSSERLQERGEELVSKGPVYQMPDLAVEIQSPGQDAKLMSEKAIYYLQNDVRMVWLVYPPKRLVEVLTNDRRELLSSEDMLDGGDVIPGFSMKVHEVFSK